MYLCFVHFYRMRYVPTVALPVPLFCLGRHQAERDQRLRELQRSHERVAALQQQQVERLAAEQEAALRRQQQLQQEHEEAERRRRAAEEAEARAKAEQVGSAGRVASRGWVGGTGGEARWRGA